MGKIKQLELLNRNNNIMKTIKKIISITIFIFCTHFTYSQKFGFSPGEETLKFQKQEIDFI